MFGDVIARLAEALVAVKLLVRGLKLQWAGGEEGGEGGALGQSMGNHVKLENKTARIIK